MMHQNPILCTGFRGAHKKLSPLQRYLRIVILMRDRISLMHERNGRLGILRDRKMRPVVGPEVSKSVEINMPEQS